MNSAILQQPAQTFIKENLTIPTSKLAFKGSPFDGISIQELVSQIESKKKCDVKLPTWFKTDGIYYPNKLNIEQTSSETTAVYKANLVSGQSLIDLTGGFGVDSFAFSSQFKQVFHCEINRELSEIATHNFTILGVNNIKTIAIDGLEYLKQTNQIFDWIYIDPSRRADNFNRVFFINQCQPDLTQYLDFLFEHSNRILIKLSPLLDLTKTINDLKFVKEIHCVAVQNEVKELLFSLEKNYLKEVAVKTINFEKQIIQKYDYQFNKLSDINYSFPLKYLYEPNAAIFKSGGFTQISEQFNLFKLHPNTHLFTSDDFIDFPGRRFRILRQLPYQKQLLRKIIMDNKANISVRNFPETVAQIRKKTGIKDGGVQYLFFVSTSDKKHVVLLCEKLG